MGSRTQGQDTCLCFWVSGGSTGTFCLFIIYTLMSMHISSRKKGANGEGKKLMQWDRGQRGAGGKGRAWAAGLSSTRKVPPNQLMGIHPQSAQFFLEAHPADRLCV